MSIRSIVCTLFLAGIIGASAITLPACTTSANEVAQTSLTFEEYLDRSDEARFSTGKKEYQIQAMMVSKDTSFHNDLENTDYTITDDGETVVLKGTIGEMWASKLSSVLSSYTKPDGTSLTAADFAEKDTFIDILSIPSPNSCFAMHVPLDLNVEVNTAWGDVFHTNGANTDHGKGDYLVCRAGEDGTPDLTDVWVVNGPVFEKTYDTAGE